MFVMLTVSLQTLLILPVYLNLLLQDKGGRCDVLEIIVNITEGKKQALVGAIPFCGEYPGPRFEDKFRSSNQMDGISIADGGKMADS